MYSFMLLRFAFMLLCLIYCLGCVNFNTNTRPTENRFEYENVASWSACSDLCRARTDVDCQFWTWIDENGPAAYALQCITMSNIPNARTEPNIVSGGRECGASAGRPAIIQEFLQ